MAKQKDAFFTPKVWMAIFAVSIAGSIIYQPPYFYSGYYDAFMEAFHMTHSQIGTYIAVYAWGNLLSYIPGGIIADKVAPKKLLIVSLFGTALITLAMALWMNPFCAILTSFLFAITTCLLFWTTITKATRSIGGKDHVASVYAWSGGIKGILGFLFGLLQVWVFDLMPDNQSGIFWSIIVMAGCCAVAGVLVMIFYKDDDATANATEEDKMQIRDLPKVAKNPTLWTASLLMALFGGAYGTLSYFVPYLTSIVGLTVSQGALFNQVISYGVCLVCPIGGYIIDKYTHSTFKFFNIGMVVVIALMFVILYLPMGAVSAILICTVTYAVGAIMSSTMWSMLDEIKIPMKYAATGVGLASIVAYAPDLFLYNIYGNWLDYLGEATGYRMMWWTTIGICAAGILVSFLVQTMNKKNKVQAEA